MKVGKKLLSLMLGCTLLVSGITIPTKAAEGGRTVPHYDIRTAGGTWNGTQYKLTDGTLVTDAFFCDGTYTYYLQADGTPMTDKLTYHPDGEHIIYFDTNGHEVFTNFQYCPSVGYTCYFDSQGYIYKDQITFMNNKPYYLDGDGRMQQSGWFQFANGMDYGYANWDGTLMNNGFSYDPWGRIVFYHWNGMVARGLITDGATYYNMDTTDGHLIGTFPNTTGNTGTTDNTETPNAPENEPEHTHNYIWETNGNTRTMKCSCGATKGVTETCYNGYWGYYDSAMATALFNECNSERQAAQYIDRDALGNVIYAGNVHAVTRDSSLDVLATSRAVEVLSSWSHNGVTSYYNSENLAKGYNTVFDTVCAWAASHDHAATMTFQYYTRAGAAWFWYDQDGTGENLIGVAVMEYGE